MPGLYDFGLYDVMTQSLPITRRLGKCLDIIGVKWDTTSSDPTLTRVDANGQPALVWPTYFDLHATWGGMRRCNMNDAGVVTAYQGDPAYRSDGSNGQVMVEIPKFWYRVIDIGTDRYFWISPAASPGYKVHPMFVCGGVEMDYAYIGAFEASVYDVTANAPEVNTITVTAGASASGDLTVTLDGNYTFAVAVAASESAADVAGKIRAAGNKTDYHGVVWTVGGADADVVYTAGSTGLKTTVAVGAASTGVTTTIVKSTPGAGGYVLNDAAGYDVTAVSGDKLASVAGVKPAAGWNNATVTPAAFRTLAENRGDGWGLVAFNQWSGLQLLFAIEYASLNAQTAVSYGVANITDDTTTNMAVDTGYTAGVGTGASDLANASGQVSVAHYQTAQATTPFSYRGIENWYGNLKTWIDGINIRAERKPWIADHDYAGGLYEHPYVDTGLTLASSDGYPVAFAFGPSLDYTFLPLTVSASGSSSKYTCDRVTQSTSGRLVNAGGYFASTIGAGPFSWGLEAAAGHVFRFLGARLARWCPPFEAPAPHAPEAVLFTFDDVADDVYQNALPILEAAGFTATVYQVSGLVGTSNYATLPHLKALYAAGWDVGNHTATHAHLDELAEGAQETELETCSAYLEANGMPRAARHVAYPYGGYNADTLTAMAATGQLTGRRTYVLPDGNPYASLHEIGGTSGIGADSTVPAAKYRLRNCAAGEIVILIGHRVAAPPASAISPEAFAEVVDYVTALGCRVVTITELYDYVQAGYTWPD